MSGAWDPDAPQVEAMVLIVDNYDSFTYNLFQYLEELGARVQVCRNDRISPGEVERMAPDRIVLSPGPGTPDEAGISLEIVSCFAGRIPLLGVCLGHQVIAQAFGARIERAPRVMHGKVSWIHHDGRSIYQGVDNPFPAMRYHSLIVERGTLPPCLEISAWTEEGLVMGVRHRTQAVEGIQFHPESILTPAGKKLLRRFLEG